MPHIVPIRTYVFTTVLLLALAGATYGVAYVDLGVLNTAAALAIAAAKMILVALIFMHLRYKGGLPRIVVLAGFFWLALLISFTLTDVFTRNWMPAPAPWTMPDSR